MDPTPWWLPHLIAGLAFLAAAASAVFAFFTWRTSINAANSSEKSAEAAQDTARISKADALVCRVDLRLTPADGDDYRYHVHRTRRGRLTNHGNEVAFDVTLDREATDLRVEEFIGQTLNQGEWIDFDFHPPTVTVEVPVGQKTVDLSSNYQDMDISHWFYFKFRRPPGLGGEVVTRRFCYEKEFGHKGKELESGDA